MFWDWQFTWEILPLLAQASIITVEATILGFLIAAVFGLFFAIGRLYGPKWLSIPLTGVIEFIRSTPLLIQIFFIYYVFPEFVLSLEAMTAGVLACLPVLNWCCCAGLPIGLWAIAVLGRPEVRDAFAARARPQPADESFGPPE